MRITLFFALSLGYFNTYFAQSYEVNPNTKDTINFIDQLGKKQGKWVLFGKNKPNTCYAPTQKAEEGAYKENRKTGLWMEYFCNGNTKNKVSFVNGRPDGYAIIFHENGKVEEEGQWKIDLTSLFPVSTMAFKKMADESGENQNDYLFSLLEMITGKKPGTEIWQPIN